MSGTMREFVSALADDNSEKESDLISLDIEDDKFFLLHFIIGTYFGPDLRKHHQKQSAFQIQAANLTATFTSDELSGSLMKRAEIERVYHHILNNADPSLILKPKTLRNYFIGKSRGTKGDFPLFTDLYPSKLHPKTRVENRYNLINSIVFINDPDTSCMREECIQRFKRLTGLQSFTLRLTIDVTETNDSLAANEVLDEIDEILKEDTCLKVPITCAGNYNASTGEQSGGAAKPVFGESEVIARALAGPMVGLMDIGECEDAYLFRVLLPGVKRDERYFSCEVEDNGKVLVRGVTTTGEKQVHRFSQVFEMQTQNLCPPGHFSVSFHLPGPVHPHEFSGSFGTDGILEGIVMKNLQKQIVYS